MALETIAPDNALGEVRVVDVRLQDKLSQLFVHKSPNRLDIPGALPAADIRGFLIPRLQMFHRMASCRLF